MSTASRAQERVGRIFANELPIQERVRILLDEFKSDEKRILPPVFFVPDVSGSSRRSFEPFVSAIESREGDAYLSQQGGDEEGGGRKREEDRADQPAQRLGLTFNGRRDSTLLFRNVKKRFLDFGEATELLLDVPQLC